MSTFDNKYMIVTQYCQGRGCGECILHSGDPGADCLYDFSDQKSVEEAYKVLLDKQVFVEADCGAEQIPDMVNHPGHYESGQFECIDVMEETQGTEAVLGFCICNAFKYLYRHNRKNGIEDVKKARWYIDKYISIMERDLLMADRLEDK